MRLLVLAGFILSGASAGAHSDVDACCWTQADVQYLEKLKSRLLELEADLQQLRQPRHGVYFAGADRFFVGAGPNFQLQGPWGRISSSNGSGAFLWASVNLPQGSLVESVDCQVIDNNPSGHIQWSTRLHRRVREGSPVGINVAIQSGATTDTYADADVISVGAAAAVEPVVDNQSFNYSVVFNFTPAGASHTGLEFLGCAVHYVEYP